MAGKTPARLANALLTVATIFSAMAGAARAQVAAPEPFDTPLPEQWRVPVALFFSEWGFKNVEAILALTKAMKIGGNQPDTILMRLEHKDFCSPDLCLTIIGVIKSEHFHAQAMFFAGKMMTRSDLLSEDLFGVPGRSPLMFFTDKDIAKSNGRVVVFETPEGWIAIPSVKPVDGANKPSSGKPSKGR